MDSEIVAADWRRAEAAMFSAMIRIAEGDLPELVGCSDAGRRRAGYLLDLVAVRLRPSTSLALRRTAEDLHREVDTTRLVAAVPGDRASSSPSSDALAARWGIAPALDMARFRAEEPGLRARSSSV